jgi:hypothetical protein
MICLLPEQWSAQWHRHLRESSLARQSIQAMQHDEEVLKSGRAQYANDPHWLIAASHVIAVEFATIAAANHYWSTAPGPQR